MLRTILFSALIVFALSFQTPRYETGLENSIHFAPVPYHILHSQNNVPRSVDVTVKFNNKFDYLPKVGAACSLLDWQGGTPAGFRYSIESVTNTGILQSQHNSYTLFSLIGWQFSTPESTFSSLKQRSSDPSSLAKATDQSNYKFRSKEEPSPQLQLPLPFWLASSLASLTTLFSEEQFQFLYDLPKVKTTTEKTVTVAVNTFWLTNVQMVRFCIVMGEKDSIWSAESGFRIPDRNHPWVTRGASESVLPQSIDIPGTWNSGDRGVLYGFGGFDSDQTGRNTRTFVRNFKFNGNKGELELGTWWDSIQYQISYFVLIYRRDPKYKVFDPDCAEIFATCDFEGDSISVCDRILSLPDEGWNKPIRSIKVPSQKVLKLYNQEKLKGSVSIFRKDESCLKDLTFSFAQMSLEKE